MRSIRLLLKKFQFVLLSDMLSEIKREKSVTLRTCPTG